MRGSTLAGAVTAAAILLLGTGAGHAQAPDAAAAVRDFHRYCLTTHGDKDKVSAAATADKLKAVNVRGSAKGPAPLMWHAAGGALAVFDNGRCVVGLEALMADQMREALGRQVPLAEIDDRTNKGERSISVGLLLKTEGGRTDPVLLAEVRATANATMLILIERQVRLDLEKEGALDVLRERIEREANGGARAAAKASAIGDALAAFARYCLETLPDPATLSARIEEDGLGEAASTEDGTAWGLADDLLLLGTDDESCGVVLIGKHKLLAQYAFGGTTRAKQISRKKRGSDKTVTMYVGLTVTPAIRTGKLSMIQVTTAPDRTSIVRLGREYDDVIAESGMEKDLRRELSRKR
jgi:hypothetical protein